MKTKRRNAEVGNLPGFRKTTEESIKDEIKETPETPAESPAYKPGSKLQVALKDDGSIDLDSMRDSTKEKLRQAISSTPGVMPASVASSSTMLFPPQVILAMYGMLGTAEAMIAQYVGKIPKEIADRVFIYTPEEIAALTPVTSRVLQKYAADWLIKYADEIALGTMLTTMTVQKVSASIMLTKASQGQNGPNSQNTPETPEKDELNPEVKPN
jgi:hypothetical protein